MGKMFEDVSILQKVREFNTPSGMMRFSEEGGGQYFAYLYRGVGDGYALQASFFLKGRVTNEKLYSEYLSAETIADQ